jgi:hypothetical protein
MITTKQILKKIANINLNLVKGQDYWYFVYDDNVGKYNTRSVMVQNLNHMSVAEWVADGKDFCETMENPPQQRNKYQYTTIFGG